MRVLPPWWEHIAGFDDDDRWPKHPLRGTACTGLELGVGIASVLSILPAVGVLLLGRRVGRRDFTVPVKGAAYTCAAMTGFTGLTYWNEDRKARAFLRARGQSPPPWKPVDRLFSHDLDGYILLGGIAVPFFASRLLRRPWKIKVTGWKRRLGVFTLGAAPFFQAVPVIQALADDAKAKGAQLSVNQALAGLAGAKLPMGGPLNPELALAARAPSSGGSSTQPDESSAAPYYPVRGGEAIHTFSFPGGETQVPSTTRGLHSTFRSPYDTDDRHIPITNYHLSPSPGDLEAHLAELQKLRESRLHESKVLWAWLSEKEAEYHDSLTVATPGKQDAYRIHYVQSLADLQRFVWTEVVTYDWMIADTCKWMEATRSAQRNADRQDTWQAGHSQCPVQSNLSSAIAVAKLSKDAALEAQAKVQQFHTQFVLDMATVDLDDPSEDSDMIFSHASKRTLPKREALLEMRTALENLVVPLQNHVDAWTSIVAEAESRAKQDTSQKR